MVEPKEVFKSMDEAREEYVSFCLDAVKKKVEGIEKNDLRLAKVLAEMIMDKWAYHVMFNIFDNPIENFMKIYEENKIKAVGAVVAIIELINAIGNRKSMPDSYKEFFKGEA